MTLQVLDGVDRGRIFAEVPTPVTIGREEGNAVQLNDERISRYHAKIQEDQGKLVLTDLESTNGTRVNGEPIQLSILRIGDRISLGRSVLLFGSPEQIECLTAQHSHDSTSSAGTAGMPHASPLDKTRPVSAATGEFPDDAVRDEDLCYDVHFRVGEASGPRTGHEWDTSTPSAVPDLPVNLSPAQAAQLAELLLYLHQRMAAATENGVHNADDGTVRLARTAWQRIQRAQMELARYLRRIGHPDE